MTHHPELALEQAYLDRAYAHLARMRARTKQAAVDHRSRGAGGRLGHRAGPPATPGCARLDTEVDGLTFGRLDAEDGDTWYVGRRHVEDERGDPVVVDWRAPVSTPFYRATAADPMELRRRRRFLMTARQVDDLFDEVFDDPDSVDAAHHGGIPDPLLAELERSRTGEMRDIVATIAAEQDVVIRAPLDTCLVVQGGPGTGKTAVGLHRAAFLLFEHREQLDQRGRARRGSEPAVPPVHRAGAAVARGGGDPPDHGRAPRGRPGAREPTRPRSPGSRATPAWRALLAAAARAAPQGARPRTCRGQHGLGTAADPGRPTWPRRWTRSSARDVPFAVGRNAFRTRVRRLAWLGHPDSQVGGRRPDGRLRRRDAHQHRRSTPRSAKIWPSLSAPGAGEAGPHQQAGPRRRPPTGSSTPTEQARPAAARRGQAASTTSPGRWPSWCSWTRPRRCSTGSDAPTATRSSTRRRTCRPWSCEPSPAAARRGR